MPAGSGQALVASRAAASSTPTARPRPPSSPLTRNVIRNKPVTIGRPLPNYFAAILDEQLQPVAQGQSGELCLGGIGLARGYVGRPDLTREKFVENLQSKNGESPARLYRTGDLARFSPGGEIEFLGRLDTQVKIRGFRVELSEIESVLLECPGVQAAAVALREDTPGVPQLVAYLVPRADSAAG